MPLIQAGGRLGFGIRLCCGGGRITLWFSRRERWQRFCQERSYLPKFRHLIVRLICEVAIQVLISLLGINPVVHQPPERKWNRRRLPIGEENWDEPLHL